MFDIDKILKSSNEDSSDYEVVNFDLEAIKNKIPSHSSKKLCEMIVTARYLGLNEQLDVLCMEELARRRAQGDNFGFEEFIEESSKDLPQLDFSPAGFDIRQILQQAIGKK